MSLALTFPDIEELLRTYLVTQLDPSVFVGITKPLPMNGRQVVVIRADGGPQVGRALRADTVTVRVWAPDEGAATDLASQCQTALVALEETSGNGISSVDILSGSAPIVDDSLIPCRLFTAQLYVRGS
jgi:hypothetical protein